MNIRTDFDPRKDNFSLFRRKKGKHDWEWEDYGFADCLTKDGQIDLSIFLDDCTTFDDWDDFIDYEIDVIADDLKNGDESVLENIKEKLELYNEFNRYYDQLIVIHDASGSVWIEDKYVDAYTDMDSYEWVVGVAEEE